MSDFWGEYPGGDLSQYSHSTVAYVSSGPSTVKFLDLVSTSCGCTGPWTVIVQLYPMSILGPGGAPSHVTWTSVPDSAMSWLNTTVGLDNWTVEKDSFVERWGFEKKGLCLFNLFIFVDLWICGFVLVSGEMLQIVNYFRIPMKYW